MPSPGRRTRVLYKMWSKNSMLRFLFNSLNWQFIEYYCLLIFAIKLVRGLNICVLLAGRWGKTSRTRPNENDGPSILTRAPWAAGIYWIWNLDKSCMQYFYPIRSASLKQSVCHATNWLQRCFQRLTYYLKDQSKFVRLVHSLLEKKLI